MKKLAILLSLFVSLPVMADSWSSSQEVTNIFVEDDGSFNYTTSGTMINPRGCSFGRYSVPKNHPNRDLLYTHITLAWKNEYSVSTRISSSSCNGVFPVVRKISVTK